MPQHPSVPKFNLRADFGESKNFSRPRLIYSHYYVMYGNPPPTFMRNAVSQPHVKPDKKKILSH